ncbi:hypothetical protein GH714_033563 [Hevea brasiliensis]|uniref:Uncharacterized protein n=1 Tax=Hevea brasiliensis TaxID=3981 RepID=A0A6A6LPK0_HEVBR|nr:hypothetical protein GH714_033563 [Hevea brasiliensis]
MHDGTLSMEFDVQKAFELSGDDKLNVAMSYNLNDGDATIAQEEMSLGDELEECVTPQHDRYGVANIDLDMSHTKLSQSVE